MQTRITENQGLPFNVCDHPVVQRSTPSPNPFHKVFAMILEIVDIRIHPGQQAAFEAAIEHGLKTVLSKAEGFAGYKVNRGIESPERFMLQVFWHTLEDHTIKFRTSDQFVQWRAIVGPFFATPPAVEHFDLVCKS